MNSKENNLELLGRYLEGTATAEETHFLEAALRNDPTLRRQFLRYANLDSALSGGRLGALQCETGLDPARMETGPIVAEERTDNTGQANWLRWVSKRSLTAAAAMVSVLGLVALFITSLLPETSAAATLRHALEVHRAALDRCYQLEIKLDPLLQETSSLPMKFESRLWTRGDQFWIETLTGEQAVAWGRNVNGDVWIALSPELGVRLDADEVSEQLALSCELRTLRIESLLQTLLADFDLRREPGTDNSEVIHASLKPGYSHPFYRAALLEVDSQSGVLCRVALDRVQNGQPAATVVFTLTETSLQTEAAYTLAGHLTAQAKVYDHQHEPTKRSALLRQLFNKIWSSDSRN